MKTEHLRQLVIDVLCDANNTYNLLLSPNIDPHAIDADLVDIEAFWANFLTKYTNCGIVVDTSTHYLKKEPFVTQFSVYLKHVTPDELERIGAVLCQLMGCDKSYVTKKSHDQGIDIIGSKSIDLFISEKKSFIIGQSKNYAKGNVDVTDVRELAGALVLLRHKEFSQELITYADIKINSTTPLRGVFVTSYFFSRSAEILCDKSDILMFTFVDIVCIFFIAFSTGKLDIRDGENFDQAKFTALLYSIEEVS